MARWRLNEAHYLDVPGTEWEQVETDLTTGRRARKVYKVPLYLNPDWAQDWNYPGEIIVAQGKREPKDIIFEGPPTPYMEPIDDEAEAISAKHRPSWVHPITSLPGTGPDTFAVPPPVAATKRV